MQKSQIDAATLAAATVAAALALMLLPGPFAWLASIGGLILLVILFSYDREGYRSLFQSLAFSAVCGFCFALAAGAIFQFMAANGEVHLANGQWSSKWLPLTCVFATAVFWNIDRARMGAREPIELRQARGGAAIPQGFIPRTGVVPASVPDLAPSEDIQRVETAQQGETAQPERPIVATVPPQTSIFTRAPITPEPSPAPAIPEPIARAAPAAETERPAPAGPSLVRAQPLPAESPRPSPMPIIPRTGKETMIYISLMGEGLNVLRSVKAEHLGRDFYKIIDEVPEGETWQYQPGQVVRCKKQNLSSGKALVAVEEAPRAR